MLKKINNFYYSTLLILVFTSLFQAILLNLYKYFLDVTLNVNQILLEFLVLFTVNTLATWRGIQKRKHLEEIRLNKVIESSREKLKALEYSNALSKFKTQLLSLNSPQRISESIEKFMKENFQVQKVIVFYWNEEDGLFVPHNGNSKDGFHLFHPFALWLTDNDRVFHKEEIRNNINLDSNLLEATLNFFEKYNSELVIPLIMNSGLVGIILINGIPYQDKSYSEKFNHLSELKEICLMSLSNAAFYTRLIALTETLEQKVKDRTRELEETQAQLVMSEKMASLGVMVAGIAHEINTPSGVISNSAENLEKSFYFIFSNLNSIKDICSNPNQKEIFDKVLKEILGETSVKSLDSKEKFKLRRLIKEKLEKENISTNLIDEVSNFIIDKNYLHIQDLIIQLAKLGSKEIIDILKHISSAKRNIHHIQYAIKNIVRIVRALKHYSHLDQADTDEADITEGIENTLIIMHNQLKQGIEVVTNFQPVPKITCNPDQLNQVWTNLIQNSIHAMNGKGTLTINVYEKENQIVVEITDTGTGIPDEIKEKIWDPFFTTKDQGQGSGLGLGIVKGIIEKHKGSISFRSVPGETTFQVCLPIR